MSLIKNLEIDLKPKTQLQLTSDLRVRKEDENAYVVYNVADDVYCMVNQTFYDFIVELQDFAEGTFEELCNKQNLLTDDGTIKDAISFLINKKILKIIT